MNRQFAIALPTYSRCWAGHGDAKIPGFLGVGQYVSLLGLPRPRCVRIEFKLPWLMHEYPCWGPLCRRFLASFLLNPRALHRRLRAPLGLFQRHGFIGRPDPFNRISCIVRLLPPYHGLSTAHGRHLLSPHQYLPRGRRMGPHHRLRHILADG